MKKKKKTLGFWVHQFSIALAISTMLCVVLSLLFNLDKHLIIMESTPWIRWIEIIGMFIAIPVLAIVFMSNLNKRARI